MIENYGCETNIVSEKIFSYFERVEEEPRKRDSEEPIKMIENN